MARIKIEQIIEHLDNDLRRSLKKAVERTIPAAEFNDKLLFKAFVKEVGKKCNVWEQVPDRLVEPG